MDSFKAGICLKLFVVLATFIVIATASEDQNDQRSSDRRFPRQILFPGPTNFHQRRYRQNYQPQPIRQQKQTSRYESGPDYGHTGHEYGHKEEYGHGHKEEYGHHEEEHEYGHKGPEYGHGHKEEYGHHEEHEYGHKGPEYGHKEEYGHNEKHEEHGYGHEEHEYGHEDRENGHKRPNYGQSGNYKPGSGLQGQNRPSGNFGQSGPGFGQSGPDLNQNRPGSNLNRPNRPNSNLGLSNFGQNGQSNFGQTGQSNFGQTGQSNFNQNLQQQRPTNFGQSGQEQIGPIPTQSANLHRRTTRQATNGNGDEDYEDVFIFDQTSTRRPINGGQGTTRRPNGRPSVRPTQRPIRPVQPSTDTQFPFVAQPVASGCETDCIRQYVTPEYNPVCGSDGITYTNPGKIRCAARCGRNVSVAFNGACPGLNVNSI